VRWLSWATTLCLGLCACNGQIAGGGPGSDGGLPGADSGSPGAVDGSTQRPDGSSQAPDSAAQQPDGATQGPDGETQGPDATIPGNPLSGVYKGYIESFMFADASDTVVMTLTFAAGGAVTGTVLFGDAPVLAPPTDPSVGYPPGYSQSLGSTSLLEGFEFTLLQGTYTAPRLQLQVAPQELWQKWCQIQTTIYPQYDSAPGGACGPLTGYGCLPNAATMMSANGCSWSSCQQPSTPIDCGKLQLCGAGSPCSCTATSCTVQVGPMGGVSFDLQLVGGALDGSTAGIGSQGVLNVHLTKQ
jgi:hypothetical protein